MDNSHGKMEMDMVEVDLADHPEVVDAEATRITRDPLARTWTE